MPIKQLALMCLTCSCLAFSAQAGDMPTFKLAAKDGRFLPEVVTVPAGEKFRLEITNAGNDPEEFESPSLCKESVLAPGVTRTLVFAPLKPGQYPFFGDYHPRTAKGRIEAVEKN